MSVEDRGVAQPGPLRWPRHPQLAGDQPESVALYTYLLDADGELAEEFDVRARIAARQLATARVLQVAVGACDLAPWFEAAGHGLGLLILDGLLALEIRVGGRTAAELVGPGDLLQPLGPAADQLLARTCGWRALRPTRLAVLDGDFADRVRPFPQIARILHAPGVPAPARARRAPRDHVAAASRGSPGPASVASGGALGEGGAERGPAVAAAHPPPARPAGGGRAAVDLARAQAARAGGSGDRPDRRPSPAREPRAPTPGAGRARAGADRAPVAHSQRARRPIA